MSANEFPDEIVVTANSDGDFFGKESVDDIEIDMAPCAVARYRLVETGTLIVEAKFVADKKKGS